MPVGLTRYFGEYADDRGALFAGRVVVLAPHVLVFVLATEHLIAGLTVGAGK